MAHEKGGDVKVHHSFDRKESSRGLKENGEERCAIRDRLDLRHAAIEVKLTKRSEPREKQHGGRHHR